MSDTPFDFVFSSARGQWFLTPQHQAAHTALRARFADLSLWFGPAVLVAEAAVVPLLRSLQAAGFTVSI